MKRYQADLADAKQDLSDYESGSAQLASRRPDGSFVDTVPQRMEDLHRTITTLEDILARNILLATKARHSASSVSFPFPRSLI
jgi:hypothetical protein